MAKFNLSSVYTKDNIYSVLKLLKALIDTLDNYEFQDPIVDANGDQIPMTWFQKLYKSINGTDDGSVAVSKDAHVTGALNVDLSALINGTISLAKNKLGLKSVDAEKMYFSNVTLKYKGNTAYPGIVILYSYQYVAFVVDVSNGVLQFLSSPLSTITETNTGFEITSQPFGNININCSDLMSLPSRVTEAETNATAARTEASSALAKVNTLEANVSSINTSIQTMQADIESLPAKNIDATESNEVESLGTSYIGDFTYDGNTDCAVFGKVVQSQNDFTINGLVVFYNGKAYIAKDAFISATGELHSGTMTPFPSSN